MASDISDSVRAEVSQRARHRCEYCQIREEDGGFFFQIDHIISRKHGGSSSLDNLALACIVCNRHKGTDVASIDFTTGELVPLFHPRRDRWSNHFRVVEDRLEPLTNVGRVTIQLLRLNAPERRAERLLLTELGVYPAG